MEEDGIPPRKLTAKKRNWYIRRKKKRDGTRLSKEAGTWVPPPKKVKKKLPPHLQSTYARSSTFSVRPSSKGIRYPFVNGPEMQATPLKPLKPASVKPTARHPSPDVLVPNRKASGSGMAGLSIGGLPGSFCFVPQKWPKLIPWPVSGRTEGDPALVSDQFPVPNISSGNGQSTHTVPWCPTQHSGFGRCGTGPSQRITPGSPYCNVVENRLR